MASTKIINVLKNDNPEEIFDLLKKSDAEEVILILPKGSKFAKHKQYFELFKKESDSSGKLISVMTGDPIVARFVIDNDLGLLQAPTPNVSPKLRASSQSSPDVDDNSGKDFDFEKIGETSGEEINANDQDEQGEEKEEEIEIETEIENEIENTEAKPHDQEDQELEQESLNPGSAIEEGDPDQDAVTTSAYFNNEVPEVILAASRNRNNQGEMVRDILGGSGEENTKVKVRTYKEPVFDLKIKRESFDKEREDELIKMWSPRPEHNFSPKSSEGKKFLRGFKGLKKRTTTVTVIIVGAVVILAGILYATMGSAKITVRLLKQEVAFQFKAKASTEVSSVNLNTNEIPGQKFTEQKEISETFPATGQKNAVQKASGKITIYNSGSSAQRLVATTRFESVDGKIFRTPATINVPGATKSGDKIIPGSITQVVYADKAGEEYNIPAGRFTIPGFKDTPKFDEFYATSEAPMSGGIVGQSKAITESDFSSAQEKLTTELKKQILDSLKSKVGDLKIPDSISVKIEAPVTNAKAGEAASELKMTLKGSAEIIAFRESDIWDLVKNYNFKSDGTEILKTSSVVSYDNPTFSPDGLSLSFNLKVTGQKVLNIDSEAVKKDILGMSSEAIKTYFKDKNNIESTRIVLGPFWVRKIPNDPSKISIVIDKGE